LLKRQFTNRIYICFLIIMPLCLIATNYFLNNKATDSQIPVGFYFDFDDKALQKELKTTLSEVSGKLNIIIYDDKSQMISDTSAAKLECSYVITEDFSTNIAKGNYADIIKVYSSPKTIISSMINELVFAAVSRVSGDDILYHYASEQNDLFINETINTDLYSSLEDNYNKQLDTGNTFTLEFNTYNKNADNHAFTVINEKPSLPIHGIIAIFLFLCLLLSIADYTSEVEKGTLIKLSTKKRLSLSSCFIHSWILPASIISFITIMLSGSADNICKEILAMLFYCILLILFGMLLNIFIKKSITITALIPILIIGSLIFTPVIIDIGAIVPLGRFIEKLFLPYYYISVF